MVFFFGVICVRSLSGIWPSCYWVRFVPIALRVSDVIDDVTAPFCSGQEKKLPLPRTFRQLTWVCVCVTGLLTLTEKRLVCMGCVRCVFAHALMCVCVEEFTPPPPPASPSLQSWRHSRSARLRECMFVSACVFVSACECVCVFVCEFAYFAHLIIIFPVLFIPPPPWLNIGRAVTHQSCTPMLITSSLSPPPPPPLVPTDAFLARRTGRWPAAIIAWVFLIFDFCLRACILFYRYRWNFLDKPCGSRRRRRRRRYHRRALRSLTPDLFLFSSVEVSRSRLGSSRAKFSAVSPVIRTPCHDWLLLPFSFPVFIALSCCCCCCLSIIIYSRGVCSPCTTRFGPCHKRSLSLVLHRDRPRSTIWLLRCFHTRHMQRFNPDNNLYKSKVQEGGKKKSLQMPNGVHIHPLLPSRVLPTNELIQIPWAVT